MTTADGLKMDHLRLQQWYQVLGYINKSYETDQDWLWLISVSYDLLV